MKRDDEALERRLGWILRGGVIASSALLTAGLALTLIHGQTFLAQDVSPALSLALIRAGLLVLIATPIARVAASAISYAVSKDWTFVVLTGIVLVELAAAVVAAISG